MQGVIEDEHFVSNFKITLTCDIILIGHLNVGRMRVAFLDQDCLSSSSEMNRHFEHFYSKNQKALKDNAADFETATRTMGDNLLTSYNLALGDHSHIRCFEVTITKRTHLVIMDNDRLVASPNFVDLLFYSQITVGSNLLTMVEADVIQTWVPTLFTVIGKHFVVPKLMGQEKPEEVPRSLVSINELQVTLDELVSAPQARRRVLAAMTDINKGTRSIITILKAISTTAEALFEINPIRKGDPAYYQQQKSIMDSIVRQFLGNLLLGREEQKEEEMSEEPLIHVSLSEEQLKEACQTIHQFSLIDLKDFFKNKKTDIIDILIGEDTFLNTLLSERLIMTPDLEEHINSTFLPQNFEAPIKMKILGKYMKAVVHSKEGGVLNYITRVITEYITTEASVRKIQNVITYVLIQARDKGRYLSQGIHVNDNLRIGFFNAIINLLIKITGCSLENQSVQIISKVMLDQALKDAGGLPIEFFRMVVEKRRLLTVANLRYIFQCPRLSHQDKKLFFENNLMQPNAHQIGPQVTTLIEEMIKNNQYLRCTDGSRSLSLVDVFQVIDSKFPQFQTEAELVEMAIKKNTLEAYHFNIVIAYDQKILLGYPVESEFRGSRLEATYNALKNFLRHMDLNLPMTYLLSNKCFSRHVIDSLEALNEDDYTPVELKVLKYKNKSLQALNTLVNCEKFLHSNRTHVEELDFYPFLLKSVATLKEEINNYSLQDFTKTSCYQDCLLFETPHMKIFGELSTYPIFMTELRDRIKRAECTAFKFSSDVENTVRDFRTKFVHFTNSSKFTLTQFNRYFDNYYDLEKQTTPFYSMIIDLLQLKDDQKKTLKANLKKFALFSKINSLTSSVEDMCTSSGNSKLNFKPNNTIKKMRSLLVSIKKTDPDVITLEMVEKADGSSMLKNPEKQDDFVLLIPSVVKEIVASPETMKFIRENLDNFIKSMREEVDNENLEVVNKLDTINKHLKFLFKEQELDKAIENLAKIGDRELKKVANYLTGIEGLVKTEISFLADKTKKDTGYSNKLIKGLLNGSTYHFTWDPSLHEYSISATCNPMSLEQAGNIGANISAIELAELLNKTMIIANDNSTHRSQESPQDQDMQMNEQDEIMERISKFSECGRYLLQLKTLLKKCKDLGIINHEYKALDNYVSNCFKIDDISAKSTATKLSVPYKKGQGISHLAKFIDEVQTLTDSFDKYVRKMYSTTSFIASHYCGKDLYWILQYLTQQGSDDHDVKESLNLLYDSYPQEAFSSLDFPTYISPEKAHVDVVDQLKYSREIFVEWTKVIIGRRQMPTNIKDNFFAGRRVVVCHGIENIFNHVFKILKDSHNHDICLSQILLCSRHTTQEQILSFTRRALMDKTCRPYFLIHLNKAGYSGLTEFRRCIEALSDEEWIESNPRIVVFNENDPLSRNILDCELFTDGNPLLKRLDDSISHEEIRKLFVKSISLAQVVVSDVSGMGKSTYINQQCKGMRRIDIFLAGEINFQTIRKRLLEAKRDMQGDLGDEFAMVIKLDFIEDFHLTAVLVDYCLYCLCLLGKFNTDHGCYIFGERVKKIYLEIGNTFAADLLSNLSVVQYFAGSNGQHLKRISAFDPEALFFSIEFDSVEQIAGRFLRSYELRLSSLSDAESLAQVSKADYRRTIETYLIDPIKKKGEFQNLTYSRYQYWLKTVAHIWRQIELSDLASKGDSQTILNQVREEILDFSIGVLGLSVKQVKTSQDEMKRIMKSIDKEKLREEALAKYQETVNSLMQTWNTAEMIVPLAIGGRILFGLTSLELFNEGRRRYGKMIELKSYIRSKNMCVNPEDVKTTLTEEYLDRLCTVTGKSFASLKKNIASFCNTGFSLTAENYMKVCLILLKAEIGIPVIMMGESGCGKTYLSHFVAECLLEEKMFDLTLYSGVTEEAFIEFMKTVVAYARDNSTSRVWVLFDEFNTSCLQSIVAEIMLDRVCSIDSSIYEIPKNIVFMACCNPYRMKNKMTNVGLVARTSSIVLSHRVYPIPERLIDYVWDFGQLTEDDEKEILKEIVRAEKLFKKADQKEDSFSTVLYKCHEYVRGIEERSGVSLRDIKRVLRLYKWFSDVLGRVVNLLQPQDRKGLPRDDIVFWSLVSATMVCYGLRLNGREQQHDFLAILTRGSNHFSQTKTYRKDEVHEILPKIAEFFLNELKKENLVPQGKCIIGEGTAINRPLKENFITMLASFDTITPMIICGAPGTSKTLSTHILNSALVPDIMRKYPLFGSFAQGINPIYYGGSETSTSEGISLVFRRGEKYIEYQGEDKPVVVFDEIGLAELSPYNPLKVLHPLLEKKDMKVGFIGLSNWTLDLSKMNRLIFISRPDMELQDLLEIFESSLTNATDSDLYKLLYENLTMLSKAYLKYRVWQKSCGKHPNFHGSRDIYSVSKYFSHIIPSLMQRKFTHGSKIEADLVEKDTLHQAIGLVRNGIERNFGGEVYEFYQKEANLQIRRTESQSLILPIDSVPKLEENVRNSLSSSEGRLRIARLSDIYETTPDLSLLNPDEQRLADRDSTVFFSSAQVFKRFFLNEAQASHSVDFGKMEAVLQDNYPVFKLVASSITDDSSRFMLIRTEGEIVENILIDTVRQEMKDAKIVDWRGVSKKESNVELFSNIKSYISLGYFVVMKNLDELYGSLYDLFNQKFIDVDGRRYCYLYFGESKHRVEVHPKFNCIILIEPNVNQTTAELEISQPAPFLNRFEKYNLRISDVFPGREFNDLLNIRTMAKIIAEGQTNQVLCLNMDMISSICKSSKKDISNKEAFEPSSIGMLDQEKYHASSPSGFITNYPTEASHLFRLSTLNYLLKPSISPEEISLLKAEHPYTNLRQALLALRSSGGNSKLCVFTFSNPIEFDAMKDSIQSEFKVVPIKSDELYGSGLETRSRRIRNYTEDLLILQVTYFEHLSIITQLKSTLSENPAIKRVLLLVHIDKNKARREILKTNIGLNFWGGWDNRVIDDIRHTDYSKAIEVRDQTLEDLFLTDQGKFTRGILQDVAISCFQKLSLERGENMIKEHLQPIRMAIEKDSDDLFIIGLQEKLKELNFIDGKLKWLHHIRRNQQNLQDYVDLEKEIFDLFMSKYGEQTKKIIGRLNQELKGFGGYTYGLLSKDKEVVKLYKERLGECISGVKITNEELNKRVATSKFYFVPFLADVYGEIDTYLVQDIFSANQGTLNQLSELNHKILTINSKRKLQGAMILQEEGDTGKMLEQISKGEVFLASKLRDILDPQFEKITNQLGNTLMNNSSLKKLIIDDILLSLLSMKKFMIPVQHRQVGFLLIYCCVVNSNCKHGSTYNLTETVMTAAYLLGTCLEDIKSITEMLVTANIHQLNLKAIFEELEASLKNVGDQEQSKGASPFNLNRLSDMLTLMEARLVPNLLTTNTTELRIRLETALETLSKQRSLRTRDVVDLKFKSVVIALGLIELMPAPHNRAYLEQLEKLREGKEIYGKQLDLHAVSTLIEKIFHEMGRQIEDKNKQILLLGEYLKMHASVENFDYYLSDKFDLVIKNLPNSKKTLDCLASVISHFIGSQFPAFWVGGEVNEQKFSEKYLSSIELTRMNRTLANFGVAKLKGLLVYVHLVDHLYLRATSGEGSAGGLRSDDTSILKLIEIIKSPVVAKRLKFNQSSCLIAAVYLRAYTHSPLNNCIADIDRLLLNIVNVKDDFFVNPSTYLLVYLMQRSHIVTGDIETLASRMKSARILVDIMNSAGDTDLMVVSTEADCNQHMLRLNDLVHAEVSKQDPAAASTLLDQPFRGSQNNTLFIFGLALINRFFVGINQTGSDSVLEAMRSNYKELVSKLKLPAAVKTVYEVIIAGNLPGIELLLASHASKVTESAKVVLKLKKTVAHILLALGCFKDQLGFTFNIGELFDLNGMSNEKFLTKLAISDKLTNFCSVMYNIIRERLGDGSYQDYGANFGKNLGIYQCSCDFVYSIGNCGYAMERSKCPKCGKDIGGGNHQAVSRAGHKHIQTLKELYDIIEKEYYAQDKHYKVHPPLSATSTEMFSSGLVKVGFEDYVKYRNKDDAEQIRGQQLRTVVHHIIDHVFLYFMKELIPPSDRHSLQPRIESLLKLTDTSNAALIGKIDGAPITTVWAYCANHLRNDFEQLKSISKLSNLSETLNLLNYGIAKLALDCFSSNKLTEIKREHFFDPQNSLKVLEDLKNAQLSSQDEQNKLIRNIIQKNADRDSPRGYVSLDMQGEPTDHRLVVGNVYPMLRHYPLGKDKIIEEFHSKVESCQNQFLRAIIKYHYVLQDFARMVEANLGLTLHINNNYNRTFTYEEAKDLDFAKLDDPTLQALFKEFKTVWTNVIPKHEDTHPDVFSFAFMCNQNLNVATYIEQLLAPGGSTLIKILLVDSSEVYAGKDILYMKGILRTLMDGFHNKLVKMARKAVAAEDERGGIKKIPVEMVTKEDLVCATDYVPVVLDNTWVNGDPTFENEINFNFQRIEYMLAKEFLRPEINCEESSIKFYNFKHSKVIESEQLVKDLENKVHPVPLTREIKNAIQEYETEEIDSSLKFITEVGEYISQNFLFAEEEKLLSDLLKLSKGSSLTKRFGQYNEKRHCTLVIGQIPEYFKLVKERNFQHLLQVNKKFYSKSIQAEHQARICDEMSRLDKSLLEQLKELMLEAMRSFIERPEFPGLQMTDYLDDTVCLASLKGIAWSQFWSVWESIDEELKKK